VGAENLVGRKAGKNRGWESMVRIYNYQLFIVKVRSGYKFKFSGIIEENLVG